ncbi:MAG: hypothetical protein JW395_2747 [Nitrospira sp.]|jgi:transposase|nr:hypothetical protein [Nitrospira sp.]
MRRRRFRRGFKLEPIRLVREREVSVAQAARDLDVHENVPRKWVGKFDSDPVQAFPGHGQMNPEQQGIERLRLEVNKLKAERDILKNPWWIQPVNATPCASLAPGVMTPCGFISEGTSPAYFLRQL